MSTQRKLRRGTSAEFASFTPVEGELCYDTTNKRSVQGDGVRTGGIPTPNFYDVQNQAFTYAAASGTNTVAITLSEAPAAYAAGQSFRFKAAATNTAGVTLNVNSLGAKTVKKMESSGKVALEAGDLISGGIYTVDYDGTDFLVSGGIPAPGGLVTLSSSNAPAGTSSIDFTGLSSDYNMYIIYICRMLPTDSSQQLQLLTSPNGGSSYDNSATNYTFAGTAIDHDGTTQTIVSASNSVIGLTTADTSASGPISGYIMIHRPSAVASTTVSWELSMVDSNGDLKIINGTGQRTAAQAVDGVRLVVSSSTFADGEFLLCGVSDP